MALEGLKWLSQLPQSNHILFLWNFELVDIDFQAGGEEYPSAHSSRGAPIGCSTISNRKGSKARVLISKNRQQHQERQELMPRFFGRMDFWALAASSVFIQISNRLSGFQVGWRQRRWEWRADAGLSRSVNSSSPSRSPAALPWSWIFLGYLTVYTSLAHPYTLQDMDMGALSPGQSCHSQWFS